MSRTTLPTAPGGGVTAEVLKAAASTPNTDVIARSGIQPGTRFSVSPELVKGTRGPDDEAPDFDTVSQRRMLAEKTFMASIRKSIRNPSEVIGGLSPMFGGPLGNLLQANPYYQLAQWAQSIDKSFTLASPLGSGLVPFDLVAPTMLIYPALTPLRNRFPRPQGQGKSHQGKVITSVLGSQPGVWANPGQRISISELPGGGSLSNWPNQLPGMGSQNAVDVNIPYRFFGLTEAVSWLAQFSGQGFDDIAALASLILLQESMLAEEKAMVGSTASAIAAPGKATGSASSPGAGQIGLSGVTGDVYVYLTAVNYFGQTANGGSSGAIAASNGQVVNLSLPQLPAGALAWNIYVGTGSADPGAAGAYLMASGVGGMTYTLQGALPTSGPTAPTADTGTSAATDYDGIISILSGHAAANGASGYPSDYLAGYFNGAVGETLSVDVLNEACQQVFNGSSNSYFASPAELWGEASDLKALSQSLASSSGQLNYQLFINQGEVNGARAGVAVSEFANPVTRDTMRLTVHPYFPQGTAVGMSYTIPQTQTNVSNVWENVMVQDYISINWPVIDVTFRYSLFFYGTLWSPAPQYNFLLQGIDRSS